MVRENREQAIEAGLPVPFAFERALTWNFGDGTSATGAQVQHAFTRAGKFHVSGFERDTLRAEVDLVVVPRHPFHLVPPDVEWALIAREQPITALAIEYARRVTGGAKVTDRLLERVPLLGFVTSGRGQDVLDPDEGCAVFRWNDTQDALATVAGVRDQLAARAAFKAWLLEEGWLFVSDVQGLMRFEADDRVLDVVADRGALYAVESHFKERVVSAQQRIEAASVLGLETRSEVADALDRLPSGPLVFWSLAPEGLGLTQLLAAGRIDGDRAQVDGRAIGSAPLWAVPSVSGPRLLDLAPSTPIAAAVGTAEVAQVANLIFGAPDSAKRRRMLEDFEADEVNLDQSLAGFDGTLDVAAYFDTERFLRSTIAAGGQPRPAFTVLAELGVRDAGVIAPLIDAVMLRWPEPPTRSKEKDVRVWRARYAGQPLELRLSPKSLEVLSGAPIVDRDDAPLRAELMKRFEGAFGAGHVSALVDIGALRQELLTPRLMKDIDPRRALTTQAIAVTVIDKLTRLQSAEVDFAPTADGAEVHLHLQLRPEPHE